MDPILPARFAVAAIVAVVLAVLLISARVPLRYNLRNLLVRWRTTFLTTLVFAMVVGLLTVMLAFVNSIYQVAAESGRPWNVIVLSDGATDEIYSSLDYSGARNIELHPTVLRDVRG